MSINRRKFLGLAGAAAGIGAVTPLSAGQRRPIVDPSTGAILVDPNTGEPLTLAEDKSDRIRIIGLENHRHDIARFKRLSDDVFDRLIATGDEVRAAPARWGDDGNLTQWNTSATIQSAYWPDIDRPELMEAFRRATGVWMRGPCACPDERGDPNAAHWLPTLASVAMPALPENLWWAVNYQDRVTGLVMRAVGVYEANRDAIMLRFDVMGVARS